MDFYEALTAAQPEAVRRRVVDQALGRVRARALEPRPEVLALYARYVAGELTWAQVHAAMRQRGQALRQRGAGR